MNIHIRHAKSDDYVDLLEVYSQPKAIAGTLQLPFPAEAVWKKRLAEQSDGICVLVAEVDDKVIGGLGLHLEANRRRRHAGYIGMAVHDAWHGKGVGSRLLESAIELADNWLNLVRL
jgi:putative acetyltransferase